MSLTPEQKEARKRGVGCSEILAALGKDPRCSRLELYKRKVGELPELNLDDNERVLAGTLLEPAIREMFSRKIGHPIIKTDQTLFHDQLPLVGHPDGLINALDEGAEFKNRDRLVFLEEYGEPGTDQVPLRDLVQCMGYMMLTTRTRWRLCAFVGGNECVEYTVEYDEELAVAIGIGLKEFWSHVEQRRPPDPQTPEDVKLLWPSAIQDFRMATPDIEDMCYTHAKTKLQLRRLQAIEGELGAAIKHFMAEAGDLVSEDGGRTLATWRNSKDTYPFDETVFAMEHPDLYAEYCKERPGSRTFINKLQREVSIDESTTASIEATGRPAALPGIGGSET